MQVRRQSMHRQACIKTPSAHTTGVGIEQMLICSDSLEDDVL